MPDTSQDPGHPAREDANRVTGAEVGQIPNLPTVAELMDRLACEEPVTLDEPSEVTIRRLRDSD
jgi:hypothetical protein